MSSSFRSVRRSLAVGGAVLLLSGAAVSVASAQTAPASPAVQSGQAQSGYQAFVDALAQKLGVTSSALETAISQARSEAGLPANDAFGPGGRAGGGGVDVNTAATAIGIPVRQLQEELATKSLADVATAHQRIDQDVTAGRLTADQATEAKQRVDERIDQFMT